jgi:hypothetical protein
MAICKIFQIKHFPFQGPPKLTQFGIFGLKTNHLATLFSRCKGKLVAN